MLGLTGNEIRTRNGSLRICRHEWILSCSSSWLGIEDGRLAATSGTGLLAIRSRAALTWSPVPPFVRLHHQDDGVANGDLFVPCRYRRNDPRRRDPWDVAVRRRSPAALSLLRPFAMCIICELTSPFKLFWKEFIRICAFTGHPIKTRFAALEITCHSLKSQQNIMPLQLSSTII